MQSVGWSVECAVEVFVRVAAASSALFTVGKNKYNGAVRCSHPQSAVNQEYRRYQYRGTAKR